MLAILAAGTLIAAYRVLSSIDLGRLLALAESLAPLLLGALAIAAALARHRLLATRRALANRRAVAVVPAEEFDAKPEAVLRFASHLARSDRSLRGWFDRRACSVRVRLIPDAEGRLVYLLEVPERSGELLRTALRGYRGLELRDAEEAIGHKHPPGKKIVRAELVLSRPSVEPLAHLGHDPDPLSPFAAVMGGLDLEHGDEASVCVDLLPAVGLRRARLRGRLRRQARRAHRRHTGASWLDRLGGAEGERRRAAGPDEALELRQIAKALESKLNDSGPLFEAQILLRCRAADRGRAKTTMQNLLGAFEALGDQNWLRVAGRPLADLDFLGSDVPWRRRRFDHRFDSGLFRPARQAILTAREMAGFLKPPTVFCPTENVLRSGALLSPPPRLPDFEPDKASLIPLGRVAEDSGERTVAVEAADTFFTYIAGRSRYGKTELAITQFVHLVRCGQGGFFLDPHGDALARIRPYLTDPEVARRVVEIDLGPRGRDAQPSWNLFELAGAGGREAEARVEAIVDAFAAAMGWGEQSTRAINLTTQAAAALAELGRALPQEIAPTIFQMPTLLGNEEWREAALAFLPSAARAFWRERFPLLSPEAITPVTNLIDRLRASTGTAALLGHSQGTFSIRAAMDEGLIVLVCPGTGGTRERLIANLLVFDLLHAARSRAELAPGERSRFCAVFDEVQSYDSESLAALLEQSAKFGMQAIFLNQNPERLRPATLNALTTNRSHLLASALNSQAAALLTKEWAGQPSPAALTRSERYRFVCQVTHRGRLSRPFGLSGIRVEDALGAGSPEALGQLEEAIASSGRRHEVADALAHLETLDARILAAIQGAGGAPGSTSARSGS